MRWVWTIVVVAMLAGLVRPGYADDEADRTEAAREFAAGQAADRKKDWPTAIQHYVRANDLVPHPNAMFNIASDYEKLDNLRQAAVWYQRYLEAAPDAPDHDKIAKLMRELAVRPSTITVRTIPPGARVLVDGEPRGTSPYSGKITGGRHRITFEYEGRSEHRDISVDFGEPAVLDLTLRGDAGTLRVIGPAGAVLVVDDLPAGALPASVELAPGPHTIKVTSYGYAPFETTATIAPNRETTITARMTRALGTVDGKTTIRAGYLVAAGGGADVRGSGVVGLVDLGVQALRYDAAVRLGKVGGQKALDFVVRGALGGGRFAPYVGVGYSIMLVEPGDGSSSSESVGGWTLIGGLRYVLTQGDHSMVAAVAESGARFYATSASTGTSSSGSSLIVPLMVALQVVYK